MTPVESHIVMDMIGTCEVPPDFEVETRDVMETGAGEQEPEGTVYGSCEEAAAAGEEQIQGSRGRWTRISGGDGAICTGWGR